MDWFRNLCKNKKNFYNIIFLLFLSILLIIFSNSSISSNKRENKDIQYTEDFIKGENVEQDMYETYMEKRLKSILSKVSGVGEVDVMITFKNGKEIITKDDKQKEKSITNEEALNGDKRQITSEKAQSETVKIGDNKPLILKEINPKVDGVLIVAKGGSNAEVKNSLIKATNALLGVEIHKIEVLEMK